MEIDGICYCYSMLFASLDPDGEMQTNSEEAIAAHLFYHYLNDLERFDQVEHTAWIIQHAFHTFGSHATANTSMPRLVRTVYDYLGKWQSSLDDGAWPHEEEAGQAGRELLLLVLRFLHPEYVTSRR